jgi:hypothetical protein
VTGESRGIGLPMIKPANSLPGWRSLEISVTGDDLVRVTIEDLDEEKLSSTRIVIPAWRERYRRRLLFQSARTFSKEDGREGASSSNSSRVTIPNSVFNDTAETFCSATFR